MGIQNYLGGLENHEQLALTYQTIFGYIVAALTLVTIAFAILHHYVMRRSRGQLVRLADLMTRQTELPNEELPNKESITPA